VASGELMTYDENGQYVGSSSLSDLMGLEVDSFLSGVAADVKIATNDHPITSTYNVNESLTQYDQFWFASFVPASAEQSTVLLEIDVNGTAHPAAQEESIFIARNDMDQAMIAAQLDQTEIPLLDIITDWKRDYNFVSSSLNLTRAVWKLVIRLAYRLSEVQCRVIRNH